MRSRIWLALLVLSALGIGAFVLLESDGTNSTGVAAVTPEAQRQPEQTDQLPPPSPIVETPSSEARVSVESTPGDDVVAHDDPPLPEANSLELRGRLSVIGLDGVERQASEGKFWISGRNLALGVEALVREGSWTAAFPDRDAVTFTHVLLSGFVVDGARVVLESPLGEVKLPANGWLDVRVRVPRPTRLRVVDGETGVDLDRITLIRSDRWSADCVHPGLSASQGVIADALTSPIDVDELIEQHGLDDHPVVVIGCPQFAWTQTRIDGERGGERVIPLERGGALDLQLIGVDPRSDAHFRLRPGRGARPYVSVALGSRDRIELADLACGRILACVEVGDWTVKPLVLGEAEIEIRAGETTRATIAVAPVPRVELARAAGRTYVPSAWESQSLLMLIQCLDPSRASKDGNETARCSQIISDRAGFDCFEWSFGLLQVGRHSLGTFKPKWSMPVEIPSGGRADFVLELPPPVEVSVRIVDADTGADVAIREVSWLPAHTRGGTETAIPNSQTLRYEFRAPAGRIVIHARDNEYSWASDVIEASGARAEATLHLRPACGFVLRLKDGQTLLPLPDEREAAPRALTGHGACSSVRLEGFAKRYWVTEPDTYSIEIPKLAGYRASPTQTVNVPARTFVDLDVQLERER